MSGQVFTATVLCKDCPALKVKPESFIFSLRTEH